jgi:NAD(P)-dependent dehydrogenase (short-subunit alcohol dehydrogenase family)
VPSVSSTETRVVIDPTELQVTLRVLAAMDTIEEEHPDFIKVRQATARMFKSVKRNRRLEKRAMIADADRVVVANTATGASDRIDDETRGIPLSITVGAPSVGTLQRSRPCYICKQHYTQVDAFYHQLCPDCAALNHAKRDARTDLTGKTALLTGGRAKIGMYIALRLLRDGAHTTITTRFPRDAVRRFASLPDQVIGLTEAMIQAGPLDILINNAAQTVRRSPGSYAPLADAESTPLPDGPLPELLTFGHTNDAHPQALAASVGAHPILAIAGGLSAAELTELALAAGSSSLARLASGTAIDAGGLVPDEHDQNSWTQFVHEVDPLEMLEVQLANVTAPFLLVSRLRPALAASGARRTYIVNVSAMEGQFGRGYKGPGHPHTNMAKASLNMLTRTSAKEMLETDGILMTSIDTGWITDERPHFTKIGSPRRASTRHSTSWMARPGSTIRSCAVRPAKTSPACSSRITHPQPGSSQRSPRQRSPRQRSPRQCSSRQRRPESERISQPSARAAPKTRRPRCCRPRGKPRSALPRAVTS